jgi:hypothetical protein
MSRRHAICMISAGSLLSGWISRAYDAAEQVVQFSVEVDVAAFLASGRSRPGAESR